MKMLRKLAAVALLPALLASLAIGCGRSSSTTTDAPAVPASSDPQGRDIVLGAVVAAHETTQGGYRLYKVIHVDFLPDPLGQEYHMIAYDPKGTTFEDAARIWRQKAVKVIMPHLLVRQVDFLTRDHRVLAVEPVTDAEKAPYLRALR